MKKNFNKSISWMMCAGLIAVACNYDSRKEIMTPCVTTQVSFSATVKPILVNNCMVCHSAANASDGINFETYSGVSGPAADGRLIGAIKHLPGFAPMPQFAPKLSDCEIAKIETWVSEGSLNN